MDEQFELPLEGMGDRMSEWRKIEGIDYDSKRLVWASHRISPHLIGSGYIDQVLEHAWHEVDYSAARTIFKTLKDGRLYCLKVEPFKRNFEYLDALGDDVRGIPYPELPELSIGYRGTLSLVETEPLRTRTPSIMEPFPLWIDSPPTWRKIRDGIRARLKEDFKPNNLMKWFIKNVVARILYLPDINPEFWGRDAF